MFVLRSKVQVRAASDDWVLLGLSGDAALPDDAEAVAVFEIPERRRIAVLAPHSAIGLWPALARNLRPVGRAAWEWLDIRHGLPLIVPQTQDQLVPQMANLELIGGVSFKKGCYPGQEIVARSQYLGKVKRRMFLASVPAEAKPRPGDALYSEELGDQASGLVVSAQPAPNGEYDLLAVAQLASREAGSVRLGSPQGPLLRFTDLPYEVKS
jgi:folate-binding protein YgfZ